MKLFLFLTTLFFHAVLSLKDIHSTTVKVLESQDGSANPPLLISITRKDILTENKQILGAKLDHILLQLEMDKEGMLKINHDVVVPLGLHQVKTQVKTVSMLPAESKKEAEAMMKLFHPGILSVQVDAKGIQVSHHGMNMRRVVITLDILELDGAQLSLDHRIQHVIDVHPDGMTSHGTPCVVGKHNDNMMKNHGKPQHGKVGKLHNMHGPLARPIAMQLGNNQPHHRHHHVHRFWAFLLCLALIGSMVSLFVLTIRIMVKFVQFWTKRDYTQVATDEKSEKYLAIVDFREDQLPPYEKA